MRHWLLSIGLVLAWVIPAWGQECDHPLAAAVSIIHGAPLPHSDLMKVVGRVEGVKGWRWIVEQNRGTASELNPDIGLEAGMIEVYFHRPELARKVGITIELNPATRWRRIKRGGIEHRFLDHAKVTYGDLVETNHYLSQQGFKFRYFDASGLANERRVLEGLAHTEVAQLPLSESGGIHFHDRGAHYYELMPEELWPTIRAQAEFALRAQDDSLVRAQLARLDSGLRQAVLETLGKTTTFFVEVLSGSFGSLMQKNQPAQMNYFVQKLAMSPRETGLSFAEDILLLKGSRLQREAQDAVQAISDRVRTLANAAPNPISDATTDSGSSNFVRRWQVELDKKLGKFSPVFVPEGE